MSKGSASMQDISPIIPLAQVQNHGMNKHGKLHQIWGSNKVNNKHKNKEMRTESNYQKYGTQTNHEHECECPKSPSFVENWQQDLELMESTKRLGL